MFRHYRTAAVMLAAGTVVALAGCSSSSDSKSSLPPSSPPSSAPPTSTSVTPSSSASTSGGSSSELIGALLAASEVGTGFTAMPATGGSDSPLPCTTAAPPLFTQFPPAQQAKQSYANSAQTIGVTETIAAYDGTAAKDAFAAAVKGFSCESGKLDGTTVKIVKRASAPGTAELESAAWDFTDGKQLGTAAIVRIGTRLTAMTFAATPQTANDIDVNKVLQKAATKVAALP